MSCGRLSWLLVIFERMLNICTSYTIVTSVMSAGYITRKLQYVLTGNLQILPVI